MKLPSLKMPSLKMSRDLRRSRPAQAVVAIVVLLVVSLALAWADVDGDQAPPTSADRAKDRVAARGYTDTVDQPLYSPDQPRPSMPRPAKLPAMIKADGACEAALNSVRDFQDANPSGLALTQATADQLSKLLATVGPGAGSVCADATSTNFRHQELDPWQLWQPPAGFTPAPAVSVPDTATATGPIPDGPPSISADPPSPSSTKKK